MSPSVSDILIVILSFYRFRARRLDPAALIPASCISANHSDQVMQINDDILRRIMNQADYEERIYPGAVKFLRGLDADTKNRIKLVIGSFSNLCYTPKCSDHCHYGVQSRWI